MKRTRDDHDVCGLCMQTYAFGKANLCGHHGTHEYGNFNPNLDQYLQWSHQWCIETLVRQEIRQSFKKDAAERSSTMIRNQTEFWEWENKYNTGKVVSALCNEFGVDAVCYSLVENYLHNYYVDSGTADRWNQVYQMLGSRLVEISNSTRLQEKKLSDEKGYEDRLGWYWPKLETRAAAAHQ